MEGKDGYSKSERRLGYGETISFYNEQVSFVLLSPSQLDLSLSNFPVLMLNEGPRR
jgi:hypothetical protein